MRAFTLALTSVFVVAAAQACGASHEDVSVPPAGDDASADGASGDTSTSDVATVDANGGDDVSAADVSTNDATPSDGAANDAATDAVVNDGSSDANAGDAKADAPTDAPIDVIADAPADAPADAKSDVACTPPKIDIGKGCVTPLVLFRGGSVSGAIGGRSGADALCATARPGLPNPPASAAAFISVSADDEIRDLPSNEGFATDVPIVGPTGKLLANDWADLLDGTIARSLASADVLGSSEIFWYSGSDKSGAVTSKTCTGWTAANTLFDASYGVSSATDEGWIHQSGESTCGLTLYSVLCVGY